MICPDCNGNDSQCFRCDGTGDVCDVCGEACEPGASKHPECAADKDDDAAKLVADSDRTAKPRGPKFTRIALPIQFPQGVRSIASQGIVAPRMPTNRLDA